MRDSAGRRPQRARPHPRPSTPADSVPIGSDSLPIGSASGENSPACWDGRPPNPERSGYHWLRRIDSVTPMPPVIWTWRADAQVWRWKREPDITPAEQAATKAYIAPVTPHDEVERLRAEVASLRLALGGRTFDAAVPEPVGCPCPGACSTVAEIGRLRVALRVNGLRAGATDAEIDEVIYGKRQIGRG